MLIYALGLDCVTIPPAFDANRFGTFTRAIDGLLVAREQLATSWNCAVFGGLGSILFRKVVRIWRHLLAFSHARA